MTLVAIIARVQAAFDAPTDSLASSPWFYLGGAASLAAWAWLLRAVL